jgi:anhydro-N-acetylmuramic acid kinase
VPKSGETLGLADADVRLVAGASVGRRSGRLKAALVRFVGEGWSLRMLRADAVSAPPDDGPREHLPERLAGLLADLAKRVGVTLSDVSVLGLHDPPAGSVGGALDAAATAEASGLTVVSHYSARDRACGGAGGPITPIPDCLLFRSPRERRLLLHVGPTLRATLLEPGADPRTIVCFDAAPCGTLLDALVHRLSDGEIGFDPNGRFAVQGKLSEPLAAHWNSHPFFDRPFPRFVEATDFDARFVDESLQFARELRLNARDVLCTANVFIARQLQSALRRAHVEPAALDKALVSGGGIANGLLWKLLNDQFEQTTLAPTDAVGVPGEALRSLHAAMLAYCVIEHLPANLPAATGAAGPRVLGSITPGDDTHWDQWVCSLADRLDAVRPAQPRLRRVA